MSSPSSDDPSIWAESLHLPTSPSSLSLSLGQDDSTSISTATSTNNNNNNNNNNKSSTPTLVPKTHAPMSFSSAFNAPSRVGTGRNNGNGRVVQPRGYANLFAEATLSGRVGGGSGEHFAFGNSGEDIPVGNGGGGSDALVRNGTSGHDLNGIGGLDYSTYLQHTPSPSSSSLMNNSSQTVYRRTGLENPYDLPFHHLLNSSTREEDDLEEMEDDTSNSTRTSLPVASTSNLNAPLDPTLVNDIPTSSLPENRKRPSSSTSTKPTQPRKRKSTLATTTLTTTTTTNTHSKSNSPAVEREEDSYAARQARKIANSARLRHKSLKKALVRPKVGKIFSGEGPGGGGEEEESEREREKELKRGRDPTTSASLLPLLTSHKNFFHAAYNALNEELIKVQIEESVLRNIKMVVLNERQRIRAPLRMEEILDQ